MKLPPGEYHFKTSVVISQYWFRYSEVPNNSLCLLIYFRFFCRSTHTLFGSIQLNLCLVPAYSLVKACMLDSKGVGWHQAPGWFHLKCIINCFEENIWCLNCVCVVDFCDWTGFFKAIYHIDKYCPKRLLVPCTLFRLIPYAVIRLLIVECILRCVILLCCSSVFC